MKLEEYQALSQNPNVRTFLDLIAKTEGVKHGYNTLFGNKKFESFADHPRQSFTFTQTDGKKNKTTAAGRYQFLKGTWDDVAKKLGLSDFSPANQDIAAIELMRQNGSLKAALAGDYATAVSRAGSTWASLPSSPYAQPKKSAAFVTKALAQLGTGGIDVSAAVQAAQPNVITPAQRLAAASVALNEDDTAQPVAAAPTLSPAQLAAQQIAPVQFETSGSSDTSTNDRLMQFAVDQQVSQDQADAIANFFGETPAPQIALPASFDESINRYLAKL